MNENPTFDLNAFVQESKETLLNPKAYFSGLKTSGGMAEPIIKALIYGVLAGVISFLWNLIGLGSIKAGIFGGAVGIMVLIWMVIGAVIGLFIGAVINLIISSICKGNTDFEANMRVVASVMVILPVGSLLGFISGINTTLGMIVALCVNLYGLYLLYFGLTESLKTNQGTTRTVMYVLAALFAVMMLAGIGTSRRVKKYMNEFEKNDTSEMMKDLN